VANRSRRRKGGGLRRLLLLLLLLAAALAGAGYYVTTRPVRRAEDPPQSLVVPQGASVLEIGGRLQALGLVPHPQLFRAVVFARGATGRLRAGEYSLTGQMSLDDVIDKMVRGDVVRHFITFPEGKNLEDMAQIAAASGIPAADFLAAARDPAPIRDLDPKAEDLEGYLFPDTYDVTHRPGMSAALVHRMVQRFRDVLAPERAALQASGRTLREVVTLASVVELETALPEERPRVAAVFLNRLERGMPLQTDPTVIYAMRKAGRWDGNIRKADLEIASPYNTYRHPGLPPGPIACPGKASLLAALHPAPTKDLYFVSRNDHSHYFSATLAEHQRAVDYYQRGHGSPPVPPAGASPTVPLESPSAGLPSPAAEASPAAASPAPSASPTAAPSPTPAASPSARPSARPHRRKPSKPAR
jgi:peptidoglycan lytic transglycosylase G